MHRDGDNYSTKPPLHPTSHMVDSLKAGQNQTNPYQESEPQKQGKKTRKPRCIYSSHQLNFLKDYYKKKSYIDNNELQQIANNLGVEPIRIKVLQACFILHFLSVNNYLADLRCNVHFNTLNHLEYM